MKRKKKVNISYIAGLFDGEGCITTSKIMKDNPTMNKRYSCTTIRMELTNTDFGLVQDCYKFFGKIGHVCDIKPRLTVIGNKSKPQKRWQLTHRQVEKVLKKLLPYLRNKDKVKKGKWVLKHYKQGITQGAKHYARA